MAFSGMVLDKSPTSRVRNLEPVALNFKNQILHTKYLAEVLEYLLEMKL